MDWPAFSARSKGSSNRPKTAVNTTEIAAVVFAGDKVVASNFDAYQAPLAEGKVDTSKTQVKTAGAKNLLSKKELGEAYGAMPAGTWLPQANAYEGLIAGKTVAEIKALSLEEIAEAGCTMKSTPAVFARNVEEAAAHFDGAGYTGETL